jgi:hypothetical protein
MINRLDLEITRGSNTMMCKGRDDDALMLGGNIDVMQVIVFFASGCAKQDSRSVIIRINTVARFAVARFVKTVARFVKTVARPKVIAAGVIFTTLLLLLLVVLLLVIVIVNVVLVVIVLLPITWNS